MNACTTSYVKKWMGESGAGPTVDERIELLIPAISSEIEVVLGFGIELKKRTEHPRHNRGAKTLRLGARPIRSVESFDYSLTRDWESPTAVPEDSYWIDKEGGRLHLDVPIEANTQGIFRVVYKAGLASTPEEMETAHPKIAQAAAMWVADWYDRGHKISARASIVQQGTALYEAALKIPPAVLQLLGPSARVG